MELYEVFENGTVAEESTAVKDVKIGARYKALEIVSHSQFKGRPQTCFRETGFPTREVTIAITHDGEKPLAFETNDSKTDKMAAGHLATVVLRPYFYIMHTYINREENDEDGVRSVLFSIDSLEQERYMNSDAITLRVLEHEYSILKFNFGAKFRPAVEHSLRGIFETEGDQLASKYCFNPNRMISIRLLVPDEKGQLHGYFDDGKPIFLNKQAADMQFNSLGEKGDFDTIARCFHSRKFKNYDHIFVDGVPIRPLKEYALQSYRDYIHEQYNAPTDIKQVTTITGTKYYAVTNNKGELRLLYFASSGFASFSLNQYEMEFITEIQDVEE